jgi:hypothetical protein
MLILANGFLSYVFSTSKSIKLGHMGGISSRYFSMLFKHFKQLLD